MAKARSREALAQVKAATARYRVGPGRQTGTGGENMKALKVGQRVQVVAEGTALWVGTVGIVMADDVVGVTLNVKGATVTVPRSSVIKSR